MKKAKKSNSLTIGVKIGAREEFFKRGRRIAQILDKGKPLLDSHRAIIFEDPEELALFLSKLKLTLLKIIRKQPDSVSALAKKLHRTRASINKDIRLLESVGIVKSDYVINPGHGRYRIIRTTDSRPIKLQVEAVI